MNQRLRHLLIRYTPEFLLEQAKKFKKEQRRGALKKMAQENPITKEQLIHDLQQIGLRAGDSVLVHCSMSKIGYVEGGVATVVEALLTVVTYEGNVLMPAFPASGRNKTYLDEHPVFDVRTTPSQMGALSEYFRTLPSTKRSLHPTDSICAIGADAAFLTEGHFGELTPYTENSPFCRLCMLNGKILMLGTTLNGACTNLHTLEDAVTFPYPVYSDEVYDIEVIDVNGERHHMQTKVHNPTWSAKRNCDALKPGFEQAGILVNGKIGQADSMLIDANGMLLTMIDNFNKHGVTMYTPAGTH